MMIMSTKLSKTMYLAVPNIFVNILAEDLFSISFPFQVFRRQKLVYIIFRVHIKSVPVVGTPFRLQPLPEYNLQNRFHIVSPAHNRHVKIKVVASMQCPKLRIFLMHTSGAGSPKPCTRPNMSAHFQDHAMFHHAL